MENNPKLIKRGPTFIPDYRVSFKTSRGSLYPKPASWLGLFFAISYNKLALVT